MTIGSRQARVDFGKAGLFTIILKNSRNCPDAKADTVCRGVQGQELPSAFGRFIKELTASGGPSSAVTSTAKRTESSG